MKVDYVAYRLREIGEETNIVGDISTDAETVSVLIVNPDSGKPADALANEFLRLTADERLFLQSDNSEPALLHVSVPESMTYLQVNRLVEILDDVAHALREMFDDANMEEEEDEPWEI